MVWLRICALICGHLLAGRRPNRLKLMALRTLVFSSDERAAQVLTQHLAEFELEAMVCPNIFSALENLAKYRFDGIIADWNDDPEATFLIKRAKEQDLNRGAMVVAVVRNESEVARAYDAGAKAILLRPLESGEIRETLTKARPYMLERAITENNGPAAGTNVGGTSPKSGMDGEVMPIASPMAQIFSGRWQSEPPAFDQNAKPEESFYEAAKRSRIPKLLLGGLAVIAVSPLLVRWFIAVAPKAQSGIQQVTQKLRGNGQLAPPPAIDNSFDTSNVVTSPSGRVRVVTSYGVIGAGVAHLPFRHEQWPEFALQVERPNVPVRPKPSGKIPESIQRSAPIVAGHPIEVAPSLMPGVSEPIAISEESARQLIEHSVDPTYPQEAVNAGIQGAVVLQAKISRDGSVREVQLVDGYFVLGRAVLQAVKQWRFRPYLVNGHAVEAQTTLTFNFRLPTVSGVAPRGVE